MTDFSAGALFYIMFMALRELAQRTGINVSPFLMQYHYDENSYCWPVEDNGALRPPSRMDSPAESRPRSQRTYEPTTPPEGRPASERKPHTTPPAEPPFSNRSPFTPEGRPASERKTHPTPPADSESDRGFFWHIGPPPPAELPPSSRSRRAEPTTPPEGRPASERKPHPTPPANLHLQVGGRMSEPLRVHVLLFQQVRHRVPLVHLQV